MTKTKHKLKITYRKTSELIPYKNNPRLNEEAVPDVAKSIEDFDFLVPIVIDKDDVVVAGHTRLLAAKKLGLEEVPTVCADHLNGDEIKAFRLVDNQTSTKSGWDFPLLDIEWEGLEQKGWDRQDYGFMNYSDEEPFGGFGDDEGEEVPGPMGGDGEKLYPLVVNCHTEEDRDMVMELMEAEGRSCRKLR